MQTLITRCKQLLLVLATAAIAIYGVRAFDSRRFPDLGPEYRLHFEHEFDDSDEEETDWAEYLAIEDRLEAELKASIDPASRPDSLLDRYSDNSLTNPGGFDGNWNHSYELRAANATGSAVMLHGLTDSPYSMLSMAQTAVGAGYSVVVPRMPGHGFAVGGMLQTRWEDWTAAVRIAVLRADELRKPGEPLLMAGYSNGGLLAIDYALQCQDDENLPCPDRIVLMSPAIAISEAAYVANWHAAISWLPYFEKFKWLSVLPEIDPFKFTSFPKRAAWEIYKIAKRTHVLLDDPNRVARLPPILTFLSVVDNTVSSNAVVSILYSRLPANGSELVVYDVNRNSTMVHLMKELPADPLNVFAGAAPLDYSVTVLRNNSSDKHDIDRAELRAGDIDFTVSRTSMEWPSEVYSLSHIAIPFPSYDPLYGDGSNSRDAGVVLGAAAPRGELGVLSLSPDYFLRTRNNPFFSFQAIHMRQWLQDSEQP